MSDPAAGKFEMPGGHCEGSEAPRAAATREWQEETGLRFPDGEWTGTWTSPDGIYQGFVYTIPREADLDIFDRHLGSDPDGDVTGSETIAWMDPRDLPGNPIVRTELLADIDVVMAALGCSPDCCGADCCTRGCCGGEAGCSCGPSGGAKETVVKCAFCPGCGGDLDDAGNCMDWQERGERARERLGIDGTMGDAQDVRHPFAAEGRHAACATCGLGDPAGVHLKDGDEDTCPCGIPVVYDEMNGWQHGDGSVSHDDGESVSEKMASVAKAADARPKGPTLHLPSLTGVWGDIYARREKLLRKHAKAVAAAWDECIAELGSARAMVREFRSKAGLVAKLADPDAKWWKDAGTAAAVAWLLRLSKAKGYPALVAALEDAIRSGMAEGEADALALAADRQGAAGFRIDRAFKAAYDRLAGDAEIADQAGAAAAGMTDGAAGDIGRVLADQAEGDGSEQDMADAADEALAGDASQSVGLGTDWALWAGIGAGALAFYQSIGTGGTGGNAADIASLIWTTASDGRVCFACQSNEDNNPYTISNAPDLPAHPRCRCSWDWAGSVASSWLDDFLT